MSEQQSESKDAKAQMLAELMRLLLVGDKTTPERARAVAQQGGVVSAAASTLLDESKKLMQLSESDDDIRTASMLITAVSRLLKAVDQERGLWDARANAHAAPKP
jgi:hypothetical protein